MGDYAGKARELVAKAEKRLKAFSLFGASSKYEDAAEMLERAANQFKLAKAWDEAAQTFIKLADVHIKLESKSEAASSWVEASKAYQKSGNPDSGKCLRMAIGYYTELGKLSMAARNIKNLAEEQEKAGAKEEAIQFYGEAAELFAAEDSTAEASKCRQKVATFAAELERYDVAITIFEDTARAAVQNNLLKFSARGHLLNAGICQLCCKDIIGIQRALEMYEDIDVNFPGSRESELLKELTAALEEGNSQMFSDSLAEYDSMSRLDGWKTSLLLRVKKRLESAEMEPEVDLT